MTPADQFGPWAKDLDPSERRVRCRTLRAVARLMAGPRASILCDALACAEADPSHLDRALVALDRLASLDRRRILGSYGPVITAPATCGA